MLGLVARAGLFVLLWVTLVEGQLAQSWPFGLAAATLATALSYRLRAPFPVIRPLALVRFLAYFARRTLQGGVDVALRALRPSMPLAPQLVRHEVRLPHDSIATTFLVQVISLMPGTLCAALDGSVATIHVIDRAWPIRAQLDELEERVAAVFGVTRGPAAPEAR